jgi:hypothetical protein
MTSIWFAVDSEGNVAMFTSGAGGAVPYNAACQGVEEDLLEELFTYVHPDRDALARPYERQHVPTRPRRLKAMPVEVQRLVVRFSGRFASTRAVQPFEIWQSLAVGVTWLSSDGRTVVPVPGQDAAYADAYTRRAELGPDYDWTPPIALQVPAPVEVVPISVAPPPVAEPPPKKKRPWWQFWAK